MRYTIFTIDGDLDANKRTMFESLFRTDKRTAGKCIPLIGCYKGVNEHSYICLSIDFNSFVQPMGFVANQESILRVSECNKKYTTLVYLAGGEQVHLGCMKSVTEPEAKAQDNWSYRPDMDQYFIAVQGTNDHYPCGISEGLTAEDISKLHGERIKAREEANGQGRYV